MSVSDGDLYSGVNAEQAFENEQPPKSIKDEMERQAATGNVLRPKYDVLHRLIGHEMAVVADVRSYMQQLPKLIDGNDIQIEFRARELYVTYLQRLDDLIQAALGEIPEDEPEDEDGGE